MEQLICSNDVYLDDLTTIYPIVLTETDYDVKKIDIDKLTNLSLNIDFGEVYKTQFAW